MIVPTTPREKIDAAVLHLRRLGVGPLAAAPPTWRLLWRLGIDVEPPLFMPFRKFALFQGIRFGLLMLLADAGIHAWVEGGAFLLWPTIAVWALGGMAFGVISAEICWHRARRLDLVRWAEFAVGVPGEH